MLGRFIRSIFGGGAAASGISAAPPAPAVDFVPAELVEAIRLAFVYTRGERDPEDGFRVYIRLSTVGEWRWAGIEDCEALLSRTWPELGRTARRRAALLIRDRIAQGNRDEARGLRRRGRWMDMEDGPRFGWADRPW